MKPKVLYADLNDFFGISRIKIFEELLENSNIDSFIKENDIVAIKMHFGEKGNLAFVNPQYIKKLVEYIKKLGGKPFLTDTNTLNGSFRLNALDHIKTARENGFIDEIIGAPIIIADGIKGNSCVWIKADHKNIKEFSIGKEIINADKIIYVSHFKGHQIGGFGGALKNLGVGSASKVGKMDIHHKFNPYIDQQKCDDCNKCLKSCYANAIIVEHNKKVILGDKCIQCCDCIQVCENEAISLYDNCEWNEVQERYIEYGATTLKAKNNEIYFINIMENITQTCGCWGFSDTYMVADIGFAVSRDPVAIDNACYNLINESQFITSNDLLGCRTTEDKFMYIYPHVDGRKQLEYAESLNMGSLDSDIEKLIGRKVSKSKILEAK